MLRYMTKTFAVCCAIIGLAFGLPDYTVSEKVGRYNIGAGAGFITGYGISYRHWFNRFGAQGTVAPYVASHNNDLHVTISTGLTGLYILKEARYVNLIAYAGPHFFYDYDEFSAFEPVSAREIELVDETFQLHVGAGPGIDIHFWRLSINVMAGFRYWTEFDGDMGLNFSGETAIYYSW